MPRRARLLALLLLAPLPGAGHSPEMATCKGSPACKACHTCEKCKYCHANKGTCGVCYRYPAGIPR